MDRISVNELLKLSVPERILLVEDIWDSIASVPDAVPLTDEQHDELDRRLEAYHANPDLGSPWDEVKSRIKQRL
jgi:putative addiction module component (TIGR02574 family)